MELSSPTEKMQADFEDGVKVKKGQRSFRLLATAFAVTVTVLILVFILLWTLIPRSSASAPAASNVCNSEACISASALLQRSIDLSADPCQDFYSFACGGFQRRSPYSPTTIDEGLGVVAEESSKLRGKVFELFYKPDLARSEDPEMNSMYQAVREMFLSCIAWHDPSRWWLPHKPNSLWNLTRQSSPMQAFDAKVLHDAFITEIDKHTSLEGFIAMLVRTQTSRLISLSRDSVNESDLLKLLEVRRTAPVLIFQTVKFPCARKWDAIHIGYMKRDSKDVGLSVTSNPDDLMTTQRFICNRNVSNAFIGTLQELQRETNSLLSGTSTFNWTSFIRILIDTRLKPATRILIERFSDFMQLLNLLAPEQSARNGPLYDIVRVDAAMSLRRFLPYQRSDVRDSRYYEQLSRDCMTMAVTAMPPVLYSMFKKAYVTDNFTLIHSLIIDITDAMKQNVDAESWIQKDSKEVIMSKISHMKSVVSYYEMPEPEIKALFRHPMLLFRKAKTFGDVVLMHKEATFRLELWFQTSETPVHDAYNVLNSPFQVNAFYSPNFNSINIMIGGIGTYKYSNDYPEYLLYGGIGNTIGHEASHGFDSEGSAYDENGTKISGTILVDQKTNFSYKNNEKCLIKSYDQLTIAPNSTRVNGTLTVTENFSDIVGINAAFRAYRNSLTRSRKAPQLLPGPLPSKLSPDQLFFVQAAQLYCSKIETKFLLSTYQYSAHSPPRARVLGTMLQSKHFARVFACKPGDRMYLSDAEKCQNW